MTGISDILGYTTFTLFFYNSFTTNFTINPFVMAIVQLKNTNGAMMELLMRMSY